MRAPAPTTAPPAAEPKRPTSGVLQRCACGGRSGPTGECAECRRKRRLQPKLRVNEPGDRYEREANRIADAVTGAPVREAAPLRIQRLAMTVDPSAREEDEEEPAVGVAQRKAQAGAHAAEAPAAVHGALGQPGRPLPEDVRADLEGRFGYDFSRVRVHTGGAAAAAAQAVQARAFTVGRDVVFNAGEFAPRTRAGGRLLAHELVHVVQQSAAAPKGGAGAGPVRQRTGGGVLARANQAEASAVLSTGSIAGVQLIPDTLNGTRVGPSAGPGGIVHDERRRVSVIVGRLTTLRGLARHLLPLWNTATPFTPPGGAGPVPITPLTEDELARGLLVYNRYYLPVPSMTRWKIGLRFPLPILIDAASGEGVLHPDQIRAMAGAFDAAWAPLLDQLPAALAAADPASVQQAARDFLAQEPTELARGIHLGARALTNVQDDREFILEVFAQVPDAFGLALAFMDFLVNHQVAALAAQPAGADVLARLQTLLASPPATLSAEQQASLTRATGMLGRVAGVAAQPDPCLPNRQLTWANFQGTPPAGKASFGAETAWGAPQTVTAQGGQRLQVTMNEGRSWVRPAYAQASDPAVNGCRRVTDQCEQFFNGLGPNQTGTMTYPSGPATGCAATVLPSPPVDATSFGQCRSVIETACTSAKVLESARLLRHEQGHFDIACVLINKANAAIAGGTPVGTARTQVASRISQLSARYDQQTHHGCTAASQAQWEADLRDGLPAVSFP